MSSSCGSRKRASLRHQERSNREVSMSPLCGATCPKCAVRMRRTVVLDRFYCPSCGTALESNRTKARLMLAIICLAALPLIFGSWANW